MVFDLLLIKTNYHISVIFESARTSLNSADIHSIATGATRTATQGCVSDL